MPAYMLDTDTVSYALRGEGRVAQRMLERRPSELRLSAITLAELRFGADQKGSRRLHRLIDAFVTAIQVLPFEADAATRFGLVASALKGAGTPIGHFDALIAAHALATGHTLVTNNIRHFTRVAGLEVESWA